MSADLAEITAKITHLEETISGLLIKLDAALQRRRELAGAVQTTSELVDLLDVRADATRTAAQRIVRDAERARAGRKEAVRLVAQARRGRD